MTRKAAIRARPLGLLERRNQGYSPWFALLHRYVYLFDVGKPWWWLWWLQSLGKLISVMPTSKVFETLAASSFTVQLSFYPSDK